MKRRAWIEWTVYLGGLALFTAFDILFAASPWSALVSVMVSILGVLALRARANEWLVGLVSLAGTASLILLGDQLGTVGSFGLGECFVLIIAVTTSSRRTTRPRDWVQVVVVACALLCLPLRLWSSEVTSFGVVMIAALGCALAAGAVLKNLDNERRLAVAVATREERDGLARELHDEITNQVTGMILMVQAARRSLDSRDDFDAYLAQAEAAGGDALASMRRWVATLRATDVERNPELGTSLLADIPALLNRWRATSQQGEAKFTQTASSSIDAEVQTAAYRIIQEAVTNVSRHAPGAKWIRVSVAETAGLLVAEVLSPLDLAATADPSEGSAGLGIVGMRERAHIVGGTLTAGPVAPDSWRIRVEIPLEPSL